MTESDGPKGVGKPLKGGRVQIEWNWDLDEEEAHVSNFGMGDHRHSLGEEGRFRLKGRCKRCWGGLIGKKDIEKHEVLAIRCRVCGLLLEGDAAGNEYERMSRQSGLNLMSVLTGIGVRYRGDATFVQKIFPHIERLSPEELHLRVNESVQNASRRGRLSRGSFPAGSAGFLFLQARALMSGVERLPRESSVARFWAVDMHDDGSATVHIPTEELKEHTKTTEHELMKRLGSTMTVAFNSAFACELAMKAIGLTRLDEARRNHDLWELYGDLPEDSRARVETDFPGIGSVMEEARHTFGRWRYFEVDVGSRGISAMIDTERAFSLAKAARVLLDEAELMGLGYSVHIDATQEIFETEDQRHTHVKHKLNTTAKEAPPR